MKKNLNRWIAIGVIAALAVGLLIYNVFFKGKNTSEGPVAGRGPTSELPVKGMIVTQQSLSFTRDNITSTLTADEEVDLSFETSGKIIAIYFSEDSEVKKNDLLAKINDAPLQAQLKKYEAQVQLAEDRLYRQSALLERDAVSREAYEQAQTELAMLNADIDLIKANIAQTELRAPFDGVIGFRYVSEGAYATPSMAVARLTRTAPLKLNFAVPERYADAVSKGTRVGFTVDGFLESFEATVYAVSSEVELSTRMLDVKALYANPGRRLMPGRYAAVSVTLSELADAIVIPAEAVIKEMGMDKVYVYRGGKAQAATIEAGLRTDSRIEVITGLAPGDTLITTGTMQLRQGLAVRLESLAQ